MFFAIKCFILLTGIGRIFSVGNEIGGGSVGANELGKLINGILLVLSAIYLFTM